MQLNTAQQMTAAWLGVDPEWFDHQTAHVAVDQIRQIRDARKPPHAYRGTPPRPHFSRYSRDRKLFHV